MQPAEGAPHRDRVARILRAIPSSSEQAIDLAELVRRAGLDGGDIPRAESAMALLGVLGILHIQPTGRSEIRFRAVTPLANGCIRSLAEYLDQGTDVFLNWGRHEAGAEPVAGALDLSGPRFLFAMENRRFTEMGGSSPLARVEIAQAVIKAAAEPGGEDLYLVQYDTRSRQYQLIGGHRRPDDETIEHTIIRELDEELTDFSFDHGSDSLTELQRLERLAVSRTSGVLTQYHIVVFHLRTRREQIVLGPADRWISERELNLGRADDGGRVLFSALTELPGGLARLEPAVSAPARPSRWALVRRHPWETTGLVLAVLGLGVSILQLL